MMKTLLLFFAAIALNGQIDLEKRILLNDKVELLVPKDFKEMPQQLIDIKYARARTKPTLVLSNDKGSVNIVFSHMDRRADQQSIEAVKEITKLSFQSSMSNAEWKGDGVMMVNGKKVGYLKLITDAIDQRIYNYFFLTDLNGKLLVSTFNCTEKLLPDWEKTAELIVASLKVKEN